MSNDKVYVSKETDTMLRDYIMKKWFDLYQYLGNDYRSLNYWLRKAGIKRRIPEIQGKDIPTLYEKGKYGKIVEHNLDDLETSEKLFKYLKKQNPELLPF